MAVKHAVIGLLIEESGYPAELERRLESRFGFWRSAHSIHPIISQLKSSGLIRPVEGSDLAEDADPATVPYEVTERGLEFFADWMRQEGDGKPPPLRSTLLMKLALTRETPEELAQLHRECVRQEEWCVEQLEQVEGDEDLEQQLPNAPKDWEQVRLQLLRDAEQAHMTASIDYVSGVRREAREAYERLTGEPLEPTT